MAKRFPGVPGTIGVGIGTVNRGRPKNFSMTVPAYKPPPPPKTNPAKTPAATSTTTTTTTKTPPVDYQTQLTSDPQYQAAIGAYNSAVQNSWNSMRDTIRGGIINAGYDPTTNQELQGYFSSLGQNLPDVVKNQFGSIIDPTVIAAAAANPYSQRAQDQRAQAASLHADRYSLAARGLLNSGAFAAGESTINNAASQAAFDAISKLVGGIGAQTAGFGNAAATALSNRNAAIEAVAARLGNQPATGV